MNDETLKTLLDDAARRSAQNDDYGDMASLIASLDALAAHADTPFARAVFARLSEIVRYWPA